MSDASEAFRLPVGETLRDVWRFFIDARRDLVLIGALPVVALTIYHIGMTRLVGVHDPAQFHGEGTPPTLLDVLLIYVPSLLLYSMFAVACHRRYLMPHEGLTVWSALRWDVRKTRFLVRSLLVALIAMAVIVVPVILITLFVVIVHFATVPAGVSEPQINVALVSGIVGAAASVLFLAVYLRLSLWLPTTAVDGPFDVLECWRLGRGNTWRIFVIAVAPEFLVWLLFVLWSVIGAFLPAGSITVALLSELVLFTLTYLGLAAGIAALSAAYDRLLARVANDPLYTDDMPY